MVWFPPRRGPRRTSSESWRRFFPRLLWSIYLRGGLKPAVMHLCMRHADQPLQHVPHFKAGPNTVQSLCTPLGRVALNFQEKQLKALLKAPTNTLLQADQAALGKKKHQSGLDSRKYKFERTQKLKLNVFPFGRGKCIVVYCIYTHFSYCLQKLNWRDTDAIFRS